MSIGDNLKLLRKRKGLTQGKLAEISGLQLTQISRLENDDTDPKASTLFKLIEALKCGPEDLMAITPNQNEPAYLKRTIKKIRQLTPLKRYVVLDMVDSYCSSHTIEESDLPLTQQGDYDMISAQAYHEALHDDDKIIDDLKNETFDEAR